MTEKKPNFWLFLFPFKYLILIHFFLIYLHLINLVPFSLIYLICFILTYFNLICSISLLLD